jgi:hypothetical protein
MAGPGTISSASPRKLRAVAPGHPAENDLGHLIDAPVEALIIGTVLSEGEPAYRQVRFLEVDDFGVERHRVVWRHIIQVADEVHPTMDEIYHQASVAKTLGVAWGHGVFAGIARTSNPGHPP